MLDVLRPAGRNLGRPRVLKFVSNGDLDVVSGPLGGNFADASHVTRFNGATGAFVEEVVAAGEGGLDGVSGIEFGRDGRLLVGNIYAGGPGSQAPHPRNPRD